MPAVLLNRDMRGRHVPGYRFVELERSGGSYPAAWASLWRFALTFDPARLRARSTEPLDAERDLSQVRRDFASGSLRNNHLTTLRLALWGLFWDTGQGGSLDHEDAGLIDALLDAMHADVANGAYRPRVDAPFEPGIGVFGASFGEGQRRFWFQADPSLSRLGIYDSVAGLLLREVNDDFVVSALYMYPPRYPIEQEGPPTHVFMLLLEARARRPEAARRLPEEYDRLTRVVVNAVGVEELRRD